MSKPRAGGDGGVMNWAIGIDMYTLMCIKWMTNKDLLYKKINKIKKFKKKRKRKNCLLVSKNLCGPPHVVIVLLVFIGKMPIETKISTCRYYGS